jgi:signal transduction histidine kinase
VDDRIAILVHEVRSPVAALAAVAEALREIDGAAVARVELVRLAIGACAAIERIVTDIAVASVRLATVDPADLVHSAVAAHAVAGSNVSAQVDPALPSVEGDPVRLRQALDNLVRNAVIHGGGRSVVVAAAHVEDSIVLSVADSGEGISPDDLARIFEPGVRLDERRPGSGLGLAITRAIVGAHGGVIAVASSPSGTTFTIELPVAPPQPAT